MKRLIAIGLAALGLLTAGCEPDLPPGLGDRIPDAEFEVVDGREPPYRMINDDEILGVVEDPAKIKKAV